jgi:hypothetical protein
MHRLLTDSFISALDDIWDHARHEIGNSPSDDQARAVRQNGIAVIVSGRNVDFSDDM